ncbi:asparagine synthase (glutamine-hydrolyzing) [Streptomyces albireticuli]|uniref:asparagine synthase (glutamine-hydrolyzing) n=1 Tax=Streptomyces albireticuli TaxID=1940 RepID=UPI00147274FF|nr:asparagine synthase (glutamine-hydrolyzing) [Streptomyces albireticuli]MCD9195198.1 asparagine synthase (glutamine-hydrolyzing) [Streptomyces albireticuli]
MCRIYGYVGAGPDETALRAARDAQLSGGPDQQHCVRGENWGLGCNRLSIQDPSHGRQPFTNAGGSVHAVFNGEIYNFRAIREELAGRGVRVDGDSDGSVLVPYYELHGDRFVDRLEGMYAIALMDLRFGQRLKLWCDPLAVKSLYYAVTGDGVAFSSELSGLTALRPRPLDVDPLAVDHYMNWQCLPNGTSWYAGVSSLRPGEQLVHDVRTVVKHRPRNTCPPPAGDACTPEGLGALLTREVERMSTQSAPVAVQVSGGLDSAVIATLLRRRRADVTGFHVTHEGSHDSDEEGYAREAAAHAGIPLEVVEIREADLPDLIPATVTALGTPNATPHAVSAYVLFREIARSSFRVCFVGDGADEQFGGYRRHSTALAGDDETWRARYLDRLSLVPEAYYRRLYTPEYRALVDSGVSSRRRSLELLGRPGPSRLEQVLSFDRLHKLPSLNLRKLDHLAMAHAVEGRVPYCQPSVTAFARRAPDALKVDGARRKRILWAAGRGLVPRSVQERPKQPFTFPVDAFMTPGTKLWDFTTDVLARPRLCDSGFLSGPAVRRVLAEHTEGRDHARLLWGLMVLELSLPRIPGAPFR